MSLALETRDAKKHGERNMSEHDETRVVTKNLYAVLTTPVVERDKIVKPCRII